jgi:hypothetical protein
MPANSPGAAEGTRPGEEEAVVATLLALLDAISNRDKAVLREILMPEGVSTHTRDGKVFQVRFERQVATAITSYRSVASS